MCFLSRSGLSSGGLSDCWFWNSTSRRVSRLWRLRLEWLHLSRGSWILRHWLIELYSDQSVLTSLPVALQVRESLKMTDVDSAKVKRLWRRRKSSKYASWRECFTGRKSASHTRATRRCVPFHHNSFEACFLAQIIVSDSNWFPSMHAAGCSSGTSPLRVATRGASHVQEDRRWPVCGAHS